MKPNLRISFLLCIILAALLLTGCVSVPIVSQDGGLVIGQPYHLNSGETLSNDLTVIGGNTALDQGSTVNGNVAVIGGNVTVDGTVNGDVSAVGSDITLGNSAVVSGSVNSVGGTVNKSSGAVVQNQNRGTSPAIPHIATLPTQAMNVNFDPIGGPLMAIFQALALAALAVVLNLFVPTPMDRAGRAAVGAPVASGGVGCLTILVLLVMILTLILIPVSILGFMVAGIAALFGWLALGLMVGRQLAVWLKQPWTDPINAGAGTLVITLLAGLLNIIPCVGWTAGALLGLVALGAAVLTRFGTQIYPSPYTAAVARPGAYPPPPTTGPYPQPGSRVYPPESDHPGENPPAGPEGSNNA